MFVKTSKKLVTGILALVMLLSLCACGGQSNTPSNTQPSAPTTTQPSNNTEPSNNAEANTPSTVEYESLNIVFAHDAGPGTPTEAAAEMFKKLIEERSGGKITVDLFPGGQLSGNNAFTTSSMLQSGDINMACINGLNNELWEIYKFPYLFSNLDEVYASEDSASGRYMLDSLQNDGIYGLSFWDVGFRVFTAKKPLNDVNEMKGLKLRIIDSTAFTTFAKALGANPVSTSMGELYTALQQGAADTQENPLATICSRAFYEVTPYVTLTNHVWTYYVFGANLDWWNSLPQATRDLIEEVNAEATAEHRKLAEDLQESYKQKIIENNGTIVELTDEELAAWVAIGRSTHQELESIVGSELLELFYNDIGIEKTW